MLGHYCWLLVLGVPAVSFARPFLTIPAELLLDGQPLSGVEAPAASEAPPRQFTIPLFRESIWYGVVGVGTPAQPMRLLFDTGSSDLWVRSTFCQLSACRDSWSGNALVNTTAFDASRSTTHQLHPSSSTSTTSTSTTTGTTTGTGNGVEKASVNMDVLVYPIRYGTGSVDVALIRDTVQFTTLDGSVVRVPDQDLGLSVRQTEFPFAALQFDGIVGLGFPKLALNQTQTIMTTMQEQGTIARRMLSYLIGQQNQTASSSSATPPSTSAMLDQSVTVLKQADGSKVYLPDTPLGELTIGGYQRDRFVGSLQWVSLSKALYWQVDLVGLWYGDELILNVNDTLSASEHATNASQSRWPWADNHPVTYRQPAVMDTGTTLIILPKVIGRRLNHLMRGWRLPFLHNVLVKCSRIAELKNITFTFRADPRNDDEVENGGSGSEFVQLTLTPQQYVFGKKAGDGIPIIDRCYTYFEVDDITDGQGISSLTAAATAATQTTKEENDVAILGEGFLRNFYTVWDEDYERIGFGALAEKPAPAALTA